MSNQDYYQKYIKYKQKYLSTKMIQKGGTKKVFDLEINF